MKITIDTLKERPLSYSSIKEFAKSPRHYIQYLTESRSASKEMNLGSIIHALLLYPSEFDMLFAIAPDVDRRTKDGRIAWDDFASTVKDKTVITNSELNDAKSIVDIALESTKVRSAIEQCNAFEQEFRQDINGLPFRGFADGLSDSYILEVKTMSDASPQNIIREFNNRKYHIQAALYSKVFNLPVKYLVVETKTPYNYVVCDASDDYINYGNIELQKLCDRFKECMDLDAFNTGYEFNMDSEFTIGLPSWVK